MAVLRPAWPRQCVAEFGVRRGGRGRRAGRDGQAAAEAGEKRLLQGEFAAEGVNGGDAQLRGQFEQLPAGGVGALEDAPASAVGSGARTRRGCVAHFGAAAMVK